MQKKIISIALFIALFLSIQLYAEKLTQKPEDNKNYDYTSLLAKVKSNDTTVSFFDLRFAYTLTASYDPYATTYYPLRSRMFDAMKINDYHNALIYADSILENNYVDMDAQFVCSVSYDALKDANKSKYHSWVLNKLLYSILESGDGEKPETAYFVISGQEEYFTLYALGLEAKQQSLVDYQGTGVDILTVVNPKTQDSIDIHFNIATPLSKLGKDIKK